MKKAVVILLISAVLLSLAGCSVTSYSSYDNESKYTAATNAVITDEIDEIEINWISGSVKIETYDGDGIKIAETSSLDKKSDSIGEATENKTLSESLKMRYLSEDGKLTVQFCKSGLKVRSSAVSKLEKELTVYVPAGREFKLINANTVSAGLYMNGVTAELIRCDAVSAANKLVGCKANEIKVNTVSGDTEITTKDVLCKTTFKSVSGDLTAEAEGIADLDVSCTSADVILNVTKADFTLKLTGVTASLEANGINYEKTEEKAYKFGDGSGKITVDGVSAKVSVKQK